MMNRNEGFAYIALLASITVLMLVLTSASEVASQSLKREREYQLFFVGEQIRNAIGRYYENTPQGTKAFPKSLNVLLHDERFINNTRHLRQIYLDPMTNTRDWGLVQNENKQIIGVFSTSTESLLITNLDPNVVTIDAGQPVLNYSHLKFIYQPNNAANKAKN